MLEGGTDKRGRRTGGGGELYVSKKKVLENKIIKKRKRQGRNAHVIPKFYFWHFRRFSQAVGSEQIKAKPHRRARMPAPLRAPAPPSPTSKRLQQFQPPSSRDGRCGGNVQEREVRGPGPRTAAARGAGRGGPGGRRGPAGGGGAARCCVARSLAGRGRGEVRNRKEAEALTRGTLKIKI